MAKMMVAVEEEDEDDEGKDEKAENEGKSCKEIHDSEFPKYLIIGSFINCCIKQIISNHFKSFHKLFFNRSIR